MAKYDTEKMHRFASFHAVKFWNCALKIFGPQGTSKIENVQAN